MVYPDGTSALGDVSLTIEHGEFVSLVGPSGCGKSTLLRVISGLETPTGGRCQLAEASIGHVFQDPTLLPWRNVQRNVELLAELDGVSKAERQRRAREAIALVHLSGQESKYPKQLSGGMKMRCSLARSLVMEPKIFLFDEPFSAVDEITRERLNGELLRLAQDLGFAGLFVTHSIAEAVFLATRVLVMSASPARIIADIDLDLPRGRDQSLRYSPIFAARCAQVSEALRRARHEDTRSAAASDALDERQR